ncbi:hypothetical protein K2173_005175 [Erythroxylum novogranatense]|uniref:Uncharacterized protein n=1 Tax=Erythroxylum novogranatense TaxID=1862640 RepID=A0AAV8TRJ4_9ROSI|nr:hypothetical protein K2173_005175 [Erythroxylum novogranatense]
MVDAIISTVVEDLTSMMLSTIKEEVKLVTGVNDEVKKLVRNFKNIQDLLDDAEEQQLKEASVKNWLLDLKTVSYDMDDVIDEWKTWIQTSQRQLQPPPSDRISTLKHKVFSIFRCNCFTLRDVGLRHVIGRRIKEIHQTLDDIAAGKDLLQLHSTNRSDKQVERHVTTSFVETQKVKGRDVEKDQVKSMILETKSNPHIISLVGLGGIGKTTLAKLIYNDSEIENHFEKKIWVCVSEPFDEMRIAKAILESLRGPSIAHDFKELDNVLREIRKDLNEKTFLLVLDDVWNENPSKWEELKQSLACGLLGSTILVTTRNKRVAIVMGCNPDSIHEVELLTPDDCWSIISQITLVQGDGQRLESIGKKIAEKCKGLPLVANIVGGFLRFKKTEKEWLRVLEKKEWEGSDVLDPLKLSYYDLPLSLKQCFKYCAIFPKDSMIYESRLIELWMAQGYLRGKEENEDLEIIGGTYFSNLISRSLFQNVIGGTILHDMVSDLAQTFAKDECLMIEVSNGTEFSENSLSSNANARHLTLVIEKDASFPEFIYDLNKLRSLMIQFLGYGSSLAVDAVKNIFDRLTCLRTLNLSDCGIKEVPSSINRLVHLRWLDLSRNENLEKLPKTLCECYNLQTLNLIYCPIELPQEIGKLINLMFLDIRYCRKINYLPKGFGNLLHLKELRDFIVGVYENKTSCIVEMEKLNNLRKDLVIKGLGNVRNIEEARKAQLMKKKNITGLKLVFDGDHVQEDEEELLETLEPPSDLETLRIEEYGGKMLFPSWVMKLNLLRALRIANCRNCKELPPLGKLSSLEKLYLRNMGVKRVGVEFLGIEKEKKTATSFLSFPKLKTLWFEEFSEWKEWDDIDGWLMESFNNTITVMPCLKSLSIMYCPKLKTLPYCLLSPTITPQLQMLEIVDCDALQPIQTDKLSHIPYLYLPKLPEAEQEEEIEDGEEEKEEERGIFF